MTTQEKIDLLVSLARLRLLKLEYSNVILEAASALKDCSELVPLAMDFQNGGCFGNMVEWGGSITIGGFKLMLEFCKANSESFVEFHKKDEEDEKKT